MKFCWCTIMVNNMEDSLKFYQEIIGLDVNERFESIPGKEICFLGEGETKVELICDANETASNEGTDICLGFEVESLDKMVDFIKEKGLKVDSGPYQPNPHIKFFYVKDPNNVKIQFVEKM